MKNKLASTCKKKRVLVLEYTRGDVAVLVGGRDHNENLFSHKIMLYMPYDEQIHKL